MQHNNLNNQSESKHTQTLDFIVTVFWVLSHTWTQLSLRFGLWVRLPVKKKKQLSSSKHVNIQKSTNNKATMKCCQKRINPQGENWIILTFADKNEKQCSTLRTKNTSKWGKRIITSAIVQLKVRGCSRITGIKPKGEHFLPLPANLSFCYLKRDQRLNSWSIVAEDAPPADAESSSWKL